MLRRHIRREAFVLYSNSGFEKDARPPMNFRVLSTALVRQLDQRAVAQYSVPSIVLMENAGRGVVDKLCQWGAAGPVIVCCGAGNNGGDGLVIARHLDLRGIAVRVLVFVRPGRWEPQPASGGPNTTLPDAAAIGLRGDAAVNYTIVQRSGIPLAVRDSATGLPHELRGAAWIVDALLGTGSQGEPRAPLDAVIAAINASGVPVLAVDLPSGLDAETGQAAATTIRAAHTCTFVAAKPGLLAPAAKQYTGALHVLDIGAPRRLVEEMFAASEAGSPGPKVE
jgi:NAD(P)H-hydrate epimerase